nr:LnmK family bifunctional acyltransferase/decarboxylase [Acanthopleuribacter pedis]
MSHVGLGTLNEYALMVLFGSAHSTALTEGLANKPSAILDRQGRILYPAYFHTHLVVPPGCDLSDFELWDKVEVAVDIQRFGETLLESRYLLAPPGQIPDDPADWDTSALPSMAGNNLMVVDAAKGTVSAPNPETIVALPKVVRPPEAINRAQQVRLEGFGEYGGREREEMVELAVIPDVDAAPGQAMMFAKFGEMMNRAERTLFARIPRQGIPTAAFAHLKLQERQIFYYANCFAGDQLRVVLKVRRTDPPGEGLPTTQIPVCCLETQFEMVRVSDHALLALAKTRKLWSFPISHRDLANDCRRLLAAALP